jgi:hypothetical protein
MCVPNAQPTAQLSIDACFVLFVFICMLSGCHRDISTPTQQAQAQAQAETQATPDDAVHQSDPAETLAFVNRLQPEVEAFCGNCHATPRPESFIKDDWPRETAQGYMFYRRSGRSDLKIPDQDEVARYFVELSPERLSMPRSITGNPPSRMRFQPNTVARTPTAPNVGRTPCITNLKWADIGLGDGPSLLYCDVATGSVNSYWPNRKDREIQRLATLYQPVHVEPCDLDNDGKKDLIVADLGEFLAADSDLGRVVWLRRSADSDQFETVVLQDGLGRVADVRPGDFDADGDTDLIVAEFGWRETGSVFLLDNQGPESGSKPTFVRKEIDPRHGSIHVPTVDLNGDGRLDFLALISQEFEKVEAYINNGKGGFDAFTIWAAPDPTYGSSGIKLVDVDKDGDIDVLYCNGDSFDHGPKPYHSVQWLENRGEFPFVHHPISEMPGVLAIDAADYDSDGDVDFVATAMLPPTINQELGKSGIESLVLFEQISPGKFERTWIESAQCNHGAIESGDFDNDGLLDIAVGNFFRANEVDKPDFTIWRNEGKAGQ